ALLRHRGCRPLSSAALRWHMGARTPPPDGSVLITFDDGYRDFADCAWPLLREAGFTAEVFIPTAAIGGTADWDAAYGAAAPLLDWAAVAALAQEGVVFGSHFATHLDATTLSTAALADQLAGSRAAIETRLGRVPLACAAPFGAVDERFAWLAAGAGYHIGFSCRAARAGLDDPPLLVPRITVAGDWDLDTYAAALGLDR
ncbi:polysaccharide deacetylase family protein, partial [Acidisphaera rubrifaciens]|uniref:polysaccharide deacetylase family protein n=1 Tax=Acidisphaera rubrifaciens TaxID=50715 RepID=UPI0006628AED